MGTPSDWWAFLAPSASSREEAHHRHPHSEARLAQRDGHEEKVRASRIVLKFVVDIAPTASWWAGWKSALFMANLVLTLLLGTISDVTGWLQVDFGPPRREVTQETDPQNHNSAALDADVKTGLGTVADLRPAGKLLARRSAWVEAVLLILDQQSWCGSYFCFYLGEPANGFVPPKKPV
eukprot:6456627-Amphidinium_carterae.2